jgi:predicted metal-dependent RNase
VFVTHGEPAAAAAFAARIHDALGIVARVPSLGETVAIQT